MLKTASLIGLILYFAILLLVVLKEKKNSDVEDYFFAGRSLPFWAVFACFQTGNPHPIVTDNMKIIMMYGKDPRRGAGMLAA